MSDESSFLVEAGNARPEQGPDDLTQARVRAAAPSGAGAGATSERPHFQPRFFADGPSNSPDSLHNQDTSFQPARSQARPKASPNVAESPQRENVNERQQTLTDQSSAPAQTWPLRLFPGGLDSLREFPPVDYSDSDTFLGQRGAAADILLTHSVEESDREVLYQHDLLRMFRQRLKLNAFLGLLLIPLFHLFYYHHSPALAQQSRMTHLLMALVCLTYLFVSSRINSLVWARLLTVIGYTLVSLGASLVMVTLSQNQFETGALTGIQLAMLAAHSQILLSVVLLPLTLWESLVMAAIVSASLAWSSWWQVPFEGGSVSQSQLFVLITTAVFVLCVAHFQTVLRRRAFDATFDLARSAAQLQTLSTMDAVTGGFNRLYLERTLTLEINRAARFSHPLSVMMFDLDNFKIVNDTLGHTTGDEVLRIVNNAAAEAIRDVDISARYGGDEFMAVLPETDRADAMVIAERLQHQVHQQLQQHFGAGTLEGQVTLSVGIATIRPTEPLAVEQVVSLADERLYEAKRMGKNRIAV